MVSKKISCFILLLALFSCNYSGKTSLSRKDTTAIFQSILESKTFVKENICGSSDTLFLLKTKYFNGSWPQKAKYFNIAFIQDESRSKILNFGPDSPYDGRLRISILKFDEKKDTVFILMLNHGPYVYFNYKLAKKNNLWEVKSENFDSGGRRAYYGFENEQWYLDLKKKIKTHEYDAFRPKKLH